ncbi:MAG: hypothetical protein ACD_23C00067G0001 [uncultured bacterium]|nr:MAG: hypothetical protein ACD_23C00067G0001 [uncultured bacterium]
MGYAQLGVVLLNARAGTYKSIVDGHPAGIALIGLTTPSDIVKKPELTRRVGRVSASFYSPTGHKTVHSVVYADGARDLIRRVGITARIQPGTLVEVTREQIDADTYWLAITQEIL